MEIWYSDIAKKSNNISLGEIMVNFPLIEIDRISRLRNYSDQLLSAVGIKMVLDKLGSLDGWKRGENNKPSTSHELKFNISHSGNFVVVGFSKFDLGIDIEKVQKIDISDFHIVMSEKEKNEIINQEVFFEFWVKKEAILKADGAGFIKDPNLITLNGNEAVLSGQQWYLSEVNINNEYNCFVASVKERLCIDEIVEYIME